MADGVEAETAAQAQTNGDTGGGSEEDRGRMRPADIDADMREMERRKRVELIMNSRLFREELERIIETQIRDGSAGTSGLLQQISDMMGIPKHSANMFKSSNCVLPINDIRGVESMGYAKGEKILRCKLAAVFRLMDLYGWSQGVGNQITARLNQDQEHFLVNPYGMLFHEITASSLVKIDMQGNVVEQGTTNFGVNLAGFSLHAAIHAARPDIKCIVHVHTPSVLAVSALKCGLLPISQESVVIGDVSTHPYLGGLAEPEEREKVARNLGPINKILLLTNHGAVCCGETIEEAFFNVYNTIMACETQLKLMPIGVDNLVLVSEETRKQIYESARKAPDGTVKDQTPILADKIERKWRIGGMEFEALMRMLDNAGFRTGYIYRHPLVKGDPPRPKNDVEVPPAVSSLGYLFEEEEMYKQGLWKPGRKGNDRTRWLNSPNVYQKVEILETGTPDPKKITKWVDANADEWVADGSPTHSSTPVKIDAALQFVPKNTNPKEFKMLQQQIKDNRRADKISAGPQSHILEGVTWEEAKKMVDAGVTQTGDQVVVVGAASKGIIQRGYQHNAMVYKAPYAKNPFDSVTDEELNEYKKVIEKKQKGEYDTDFSESEGLSSAQISKQVDDNTLRSPTSATSETEEESRDEPRVLRIETKQAPKPSQPEVVLSDDDSVFVKTALPNQNPVIQNQENSKGLVSIKKAMGKREQAQGSCYRTYSHFGLPRGSYIAPKPSHYHVTHAAAYPALTNISGNAPNIPRPTAYNKFNHPRVTIQLEENSLGFHLPYYAIKNFVTPFANALQLWTNKNRTDQAIQTEESIPIMKVSTGTQTILNTHNLNTIDEQFNVDITSELVLTKKINTDILEDVTIENQLKIDTQQQDHTIQQNKTNKRKKKKLSHRLNASLIRTSSEDSSVFDENSNADDEWTSETSNMEISKSCDEVHSIKESRDTVDDNIETYIFISKTHTQNQTSGRDENGNHDYNGTERVVIEEEMEFPESLHNENIDENGNHTLERIISEQNKKESSTETCSHTQVVNIPVTTSLNEHEVVPGEEKANLCLPVFESNQDEAIVFAVTTQNEMEEPKVVNVPVAACPETFNLEILVNASNAVHFESQTETGNIEIWNEDKSKEENDDNGEEKQSEKFDEINNEYCSKQKINNAYSEARITDDNSTQANKEQLHLEEIEPHRILDVYSHELVKLHAETVKISSDSSVTEKANIENSTEFEDIFTTINIESPSHSDMIKIWQEPDKHLDKSTTINDVSAEVFSSNYIGPRFEKNQPKLELPKQITPEETSVDNREEYSTFKQLCDVAAALQELYENTSENNELEDEETWWKMKRENLPDVLSELIYKYLLSTCKLINKIVQIPDLQCQHSAELFFDLLKDTLAPHWNYFNQEQRKNVLKLKVVDLVARNFVDKCDFTEENVYKIQDCVSVIMYILFSIIDNPGFECIHHGSEDIMESTPTTHDSLYISYKNPEFYEDSFHSVPPNDLDDSITTFLTSQSQKTGNLAYWFMVNDKINKTPSPPSSHVKSNESKPVENEMDLCNVHNFVNRSLSPIPEEARRSLLEEFNVESDEEINYKSDTDLSKYSMQAIQGSEDEPLDSPSFRTKVSHLDTTTSDENANKFELVNNFSFVPTKHKKCSSYKFVQKLSFKPPDNERLPGNIYTYNKEFRTGNSSEGGCDSEYDWNGYENAKF